MWTSLRARALFIHRSPFKTRCLLGVWCDEKWLGARADQNRIYVSTCRSLYTIYINDVIPSTISFAASSAVQCSTAVIELWFIWYCKDIVRLAARNHHSRADRINSKRDQCQRSVNTAHTRTAWSRATRYIYIAVRSVRSRVRASYAIEMATFGDKV